MSEVTLYHPRIAVLLSQEHVCPGHHSPQVCVELGAAMYGTLRDLGVGVLCYLELNSLSEPRHSFAIAQNPL